MRDYNELDPAKSSKSICFLYFTSVDKIRADVLRVCRWTSAIFALPRANFTLKTG
jgi:hypothetical protein